MKKSVKRNIVISAIMFAIAAIFTAVVAFVDKAPTGPADSVVGLSTLNGKIFSALGVSNTWYEITSKLGYLSIAVALGFALLGVYQLIKRKKLSAIDADLMLLAALYVLFGICYVAFEIFTVNCRPILVDGVLEASYPSSHTMLFCTIVGSAPIFLHRKLKNKTVLMIIDVLTVLLTLVMSVGRLLSGVHWLTDVIGGVLISLFLISLYVTALSILDTKKTDR